MTQDDIIHMAREAGWQYADGDDGYKPLWRFAALVAAHEREACAKVCEKNGEEWADGNNDWCSGQVKGSYDCAEAIRARGDK